MHIETILDEFHLKVIRSIWLQRFTVFNRVMLAAAFLPSGLKKIVGMRFTLMPVDNPVGFFFEAFYQTGFYYNFVGWMQVITAILLLIPRTSTLGAVLFFPIVINVCLITISMNFKGTWLITSLMVLANLYLLCWDYDKLKFLLPFRQKTLAPIKRNTAFLLESALWAVPGVFGSALMVMMNPFFGFNFTGLVALALIGGGLFGPFAAWHRSKLSIADDVGPIKAN